MIARCIAAGSQNTQNILFHDPPTQPSILVGFSKFWGRFICKSEIHNQYDMKYLVYKSLQAV